MPSVVSWPTSRAASSAHSNSEPEPKFERSEYFRRTPGKGGWVCSACAPACDNDLYFFDATAAMEHEKSQAHKDAVACLTSWGPIQVGNWGEALEPYQQLRYDLSRGQDPLNKRVNRWIKGVARAEGVQLEEEEEESLTQHPWDDWGSGGDDWKRPPEEWGFPVDAVPVAEEDDPQAAADFKFVEKVARARGLTKDRRRLHAFYRLPTEEKISRIQEIVHFISCH